MRSDDQVYAASEQHLPSSGKHPLMRQQLLDLAGSLRRKPLQHILEIGIGIMPIDASRLDQTHDRRSPLVAA